MQVQQRGKATLQYTTAQVPNETVHQLITGVVQAPSIQMPGLANPCQPVDIAQIEQIGARFEQRREAAKQRREAAKERLEEKKQERQQKTGG